MKHDTAGEILDALFGKGHDKILRTLGVSTWCGYCNNKLYDAFDSTSEDAS